MMKKRVVPAGKLRHLARSVSACSREQSFRGGNRAHGAAVLEGLKKTQDLWGVKAARRKTAIFFQQARLRMAKVIAVLSPEVAAVHEFERLCLTAKFAWQYEMIRWMLSACQGAATGRLE